MADIKEILKDKILVLDGAMGTMIQRYDLTEADFRVPKVEHIKSPLQGNNDFLSVSRPDIIEAIHREYLDAGADIIETNTFSGTTISQADYELEDFVDDINIESAKIARKLTDEYTQNNPDKPRFVAGSMGPTNKTASMSPDVNDPGFRAVSFDDLKIAYAQQAKGLIQGGVHVLLVETVFDTLNAKAAVFAIKEVCEELGVDIPIMVSGTITDNSGRTLSGQTTEAFLISLLHGDLLSIGLNCALGAEQLRPYLQILSENAACHVSAYPNAGLPNEFGEYDQDAQEMQSLVRTYMEEGLINIIGGCCGTTPDHIQALAELAKEYQPRSKKDLVNYE